MTTVYSVLDADDYRRLETLSKSEASMYAACLNRKSKGARVVSSQRKPVDWTQINPTQYSK